MERSFNEKRFKDLALNTIMERDGFTILVENYTQGISNSWTIPETYKVFILNMASGENPMSTLLVIDPEQADFKRIPFTKETGKKYEKKVRERLLNAGCSIFTQYPSSSDMPRYHLIAVKKK